jgi:hypothetical protein
METSINELDSFVKARNTEEVILKLEELKDFMENDKELARYIKNPESVLEMSYNTREAVTAYSQILWAIAEYKGYNYK